MIAADTVVIVDRGGSLHVLGKPPDDDSWRETVRRWFREDFAGKTHLVATALILEHVASGKRASRVVTSRVTFIERHRSLARLVPGHGRIAASGKAGATVRCKGRAAFLPPNVEGSLSNVVGLPLAELLDMLETLSLVFIDR